jgi:hypothetical protein
MLERIAPDASETVRLAARCQHLKRWEVPRAHYAPTVAGYRAWRKDQQERHAETAATILAAVGYGPDLIAHVRAIIMKQSLKRDPDAQLLEDVAALVFFESYLEPFAARHADYDEHKLAGIVRKTARKMSARGRAAAEAAIRVPPALAALVSSAMADERAAKPDSQDWAKPLK